MSENYRVSLLPAARKDLRRLRGLEERAVRALLRLETEPDAGHRLSGRLKGFRSLEFSMPGGAYRAVYLPQHREMVCLVLVVGPHEGIYERAERRAQALRRLRGNE